MQIQPAKEEKISVESRFTVQKQERRAAENSRRTEHPEGNDEVEISDEGRKRSRSEEQK